VSRIEEVHLLTDTHILVYYTH
jgi:predicted nucleic acid-binding protein/Arc/MetJ family transcription regulator